MRDLPARPPNQLLFPLDAFLCRDHALSRGRAANDYPAVFAEYAASNAWTAIHVARFACTAILIAGLSALFFALEVQSEPAQWASRFAAGSAVVALALYGAVLAVDGVALKQAVDAWANAPATEKTARFVAAETTRWLEWGTRSYENFALGLSVLLFAVAILRSRLPAPIAYLMVTGVIYLLQGWTAGTEGFSSTHSLGIVLDEVVNAVWMIWLIVIAWRTDAMGESIGHKRTGCNVG